jgi:peptidoglycan/xylan/chitin deacetylase (PgdA/CDA1 family)
MRADRIAPLVVLALLLSSCSGSATGSDAVGSGGKGAVDEPEAEGSGAVSLRAPRRLPPSEWVLGPERDMSFLVFTGTTSPAGARQVLMRLDRSGAPGAFFLPGKFLRTHRKLSRAIVESGHHLGHTGLELRPFSRLGNSGLRRSLRKGERSVTRAGSNPRPFLIAPKHQRGHRVLTVAGRMGYRLLRPTVTLGKGKRKDIVRRAEQNARRGAIVEVRLDRRSHRRAVHGIVNALHAKKLDPAPLRKLRRADPVRWDVTLVAGDEGPRVRRLQKQLTQATFPAGAPDGVFGSGTLQAVLAFEKLYGLERDGIVDPVQMGRIVTATAPNAPKRKRRNFIEVDIERQILFEVKDGKVINTLPVSTANGEYYRSQSGSLAIASTPRGEFEIERKIPGWRQSYLGTLYKPMYFRGGYAIHGSPSVPAYPASHGCIRIPMHVADDFYERNSIGVPVYVN